MKLTNNALQPAPLPGPLHANATTLAKSPQSLHERRVQNDHRYTLKVIQRIDVIRKDGTAALSLQVFINGKRKVLPLNCHLEPKHFDRAREKVIGGVHMDTINAIIHKSKARTEQIYYKAILEDRPLSVDRFAEIYLSASSRSDFYEFMEEQMSRNVGVKQNSTLKNDRKTLNKLKKFRPSLLMHEITLEFIEDFNRYLRRADYETNTIWSHHKVIKAHINAAISRGHRLAQPYTKFKISKARTDREFLTLKEVDKLITAYRSGVFTERQNNVIRIFLFQCFASLRIQDALTLSSDNVVHDTLVFRPIKTRSSLTILKIPLSAAAKKLISDARDVQNGDNLFRSISQQKANETLKEVAALLKLNKKLTTHVGRHTFATMFLIRGGKVEVLQKIMGHADIRTTMLYVHITDQDKRESVNKIDSYFRGHLAEWSD